MRVKDLMTRDVVTVRTDTPLKEAAALLTQHRISGLPVVGDDRHVLGVLSEGDILFKEQGTRERPGLFERLLAGPPKQLDPKLSARTVGQAMTAPALTIRRASSRDRGGVDDDRGGSQPTAGGRSTTDRLIGIITRADLVRAFVRSDAEVEHGDPRGGSSAGRSGSSPDMVEVEVDGGEVRLTRRGRDEGRRGGWSPRSSQRVPGVVAVLSKLRWRTTRRAPGRCPDRPEQRRRPSGYSSQQTLLERVADELGPGREPQLLHDVRPVRLGRAHRDVEHLRDLLVRVAERQQPHHLALPVGERVGLLARPAPRPRPRPAARRAPGGRSGRRAATSWTAATTSASAASLST